jgi:IS5 family transposase
MAEYDPVIEPFYPKAGNGRRPYPLETMLRIHCVQHWYNLSDGAMEDALYEIASMRLLPDYPWIAPCRIAPPS